MRLIDIDAMSHEMYHLAFETDSNMQKWDGGCWIRYKMFERCRDNAPTIDAVEVVRCKDCKYWFENQGYYCSLMEHRTNKNFFCAAGERR